MPNQVRHKHTIILFETLTLTVSRDHQRVAEFIDIYYIIIDTKNLNKSQEKRLAAKHTTCSFGLRNKKSSMAKTMTNMKHLLLTTIAALVLVGCGPSVDIHQAAEDGSIEAVKQHLNAGTDVNAVGGLFGYTPLQQATFGGRRKISFFS